MIVSIRQAVHKMQHEPRPRRELPEIPVPCPADWDDPLLLPGYVSCYPIEACLDRSVLAGLHS